MFMLGFLIGPVVGFTMLDWAPKAFRDAFNIMTPPPVSPSLESPTAAYYASWFVPVGMVIVISVLLAWQWGRLGPRWKWLRSLFIGFRSATSAWWRCVGLSGSAASSVGAPHRDEVVIGQRHVRPGQGNARQRMTRMERHRRLELSVSELLVMSAVGDISQASSDLLVTRSSPAAKGQATNAESKSKCVATHHVRSAGHHKFGRSPRRVSAARLSEP